MIDCSFQFFPARTRPLTDKRVFRRMGRSCPRHRRKSLTGLDELSITALFNFFKYYFNKFYFFLKNT